MINYETVLSTFDDKLTLMQWLQKVEQALEGAGLESVEVHQQTPTTAYFKFIFADGTSVTTPSISLPRGAKGDTGATGATGATGNGIASITKTGTSGLIDTYTILYTNGSTQTFTVTNGAQGEAGQDGADGVGIDNVEVVYNTGVLKVTLTDETEINAGNVYNIVGINGTSGTITSQTTLNTLKSKNTFVDPLGKPLMSYYNANNLLTVFYYQSVIIDEVTGNITRALFTVDTTTGAWTYATFTVPYMVDAEERIKSLSGDTPVASGKVLMADGDGYATWEDASGGVNPSVSIASYSVVLTNEQYNLLNDYDNSVLIYTGGTNPQYYYKGKTTSTDLKFYCIYKDTDNIYKLFCINVNKTTHATSQENSQLKVGSEYGVECGSASVGQVLTVVSSGKTGWQNASGTTLNQYTANSPTLKKVIDIVSSSKGYVTGMLEFTISGVRCLIPVTCLQLAEGSYPYINVSTHYYNNGNYFLQGIISLNTNGTINSTSLLRTKEDGTHDVVNSSSYAATYVVIKYWNDTQLH